MSVNNKRNRGDQRVETVGAASMQVVPANVHRTALTFAAIGGTVFLTIENAATVTNGLPIVAGQVPFTICACHAGDWVKKTINAIADGAGRSLIIIEGYAPAGEGEMTYASENG